MNSRVGYIGGGNIAGILGLSPFKTPLDEYMLISGEEPEVITREQEEFFEDRRDLEPWAEKKFTRRTGVAVVRRNHRYEDPAYPWAKAEVDFEAEDNGNGETKTVHPNAVASWGNSETEEPPNYVTAQAMWGMGINGAPHCYVNALIGFDDHRVYKIERDSALIGMIRQKAHDFWRFHVEPRIRPDPINVDDLLRLYARDTGRAVDADSDVMTSLERLCHIRQTIKFNLTQKEVMEFAIKNYMRDATTMLVGGKPAVTWKARVNGVRVFRII